jgi:hypothetical protein
VIQKAVAVKRKRRKEGIPEEQMRFRILISTALGNLRAVLNSRFHMRY